MARTDGRTNVLLVLTDQYRHDWVGLNPDVPIRAPNFDALARRGVSFTNAVSPAPRCSPSRSCLASGMEYGRNGVASNHDFPLEQSTYYHRLRDEAGYEVFGVGDIDLHHATPAWGRDGRYLLDALGLSDGISIPGNHAGVQTYRSDLRTWWGLSDGHDASGHLPPDVDPAPNQPASPYIAYLEQRDLLEAYVADMDSRDTHAITHPAPIPHGDYIDNWIGRHGLRMLNTAPADDPWHLTVNFVGPHAPMNVSEDMHGWYRNPDVVFPSPTNPSDEYEGEIHQEIRRNYAAMIENIDQWLGRYVEALRDRGELENTVIVFTADHGELLGDHGGWAKTSPRHQSVGVPLAIAGPNVVSRDPITNPVTTIDLHATFLDYAGLDPRDIDSRSLRPFISGDVSSHCKFVHSGLEPWRMVFDGRYKLILGYDTERDPAVVGDATIDLTGRQATGHLFRRQLQPILFDLIADPEETTNVADSHPGDRRALRKRAPVDSSLARERTGFPMDGLFGTS